MSVFLCAVAFGFTARSIQWVALRARAAGFLLAEMAEGAWQRRTRWRECVERARREV